MQMLQAFRYILPTVFFGYCVVANIGFLTHETGADAAQDTPLEGSVMSGGLTAGIDGLYKAKLPHVDLSVGVVGVSRYLVLGQGRPGVLTGQGNWLFTGEETRVLSERSVDMAAALTHITQTRDTLAASGVQLVVVPVPAKIDVYRDKAPDPEFPEAMAQVYAGFVAQLTAAAIPTIETRAGLIAGRAEGDVFFATDTHWTPQGAAVVAQAVAASGLIDPGTMSYTAQPQAPADLIGDLVAYVTTDAMAPLVGLGPVAVTPYLATETGAETADAGLDDLFGASASDIVLVGTSYSANAHWSFAEALKIALGRDVVNVAKEGLGPWKPMQAFLTSDLLQDSPPAVVIWEFPVRYLSDPSTWTDTPEAKPEAATSASGTAIGGSSDG